MGRLGRRSANPPAQGRAHVPEGSRPARERDHPRQHLTLAAMLCAVAMTFIDQTIVAIAAPDITRELGLTSSGMRWVVNGYLLALAASFALAGRIADVFGHRRTVLLGTVVFVSASALCGAVPAGSWAQEWLVFFRVVQGTGAALLFPAALAIVVAAFPLRKRGRALALFFGLSGALTAVGPLLGGWLTTWTWRAVFWVNVPVALAAVLLTFAAQVRDRPVRERVDWAGAALVALGMGLSVLGLQQASSWGWGSAATWCCILGGLLFLLLFVAWEWRADVPLIKVRNFTDRAFALDMTVLFFSMTAFVPVLFFASVYAQVSLGYSANEAATYLLVFFAGFAVAAQVGGRVLDARGAKPSLVAGGALGAFGFWLWSTKVEDLSLGDQWHAIVLAGAGIGLVLGPASTDALNRGGDTSYGEVTGISQTVRNYASAAGLAVFGTALAHNSVNRFTDTFRARGLSGSEARQAAEDAGSAVTGHGQDSAPTGDSAREEFVRSVMGAVREDFAAANQVVLVLMAVAMALAFAVALFHPGGRPDAATPRGTADSARPSPPE